MTRVDELDEEVTDSELRALCKRRGYRMVLTDVERNWRDQLADLERRARKLGMWVCDFGARQAPTFVIGEGEPDISSNMLSSRLCYDDALAFLAWCKPTTDAERAVSRINGIRAVLDMRPTKWTPPKESR